MAVTLLRIVLPVLLFALCQVAESAKIKAVTLGELLEGVKKCEVTHIKPVKYENRFQNLEEYTTETTGADSFAEIKATLSSVLSEKSIPLAYTASGKPPVYVVPVLVTEEQDMPVDGGKEHAVGVDGGEEHTVGVDGGEKVLTYGLMFEEDLNATPDSKEKLFTEVNCKATESSLTDGGHKKIRYENGEAHITLVVQMASPQIAARVKRISKP
eukprot:GHVS01038382.1.p1 GENE.GHVS01038382.1~~GHVS01038382.1.p1  ORF type:complete len:213 (+),score=31.94 GHVS01038382.1:153-791(+)